MSTDSLSLSLSISNRRHSISTNFLFIIPIVIVFIDPFGFSVLPDKIEYQVLFVLHRYYSEAIDSGAAPAPLSSDRTVDVQCVIAIMDHLLACEATWHRGHSLAQTVFPCIYLLKPDRTSPHALLHSYCRVIRAPGRRSFHNDQWFSFEGDGDEKCLSMLHAVEETISRQLQAYKAPPSKRKVVEDIEPLQMNPDLKEEFCKETVWRSR